MAAGDTTPARRMHPETRPWELEAGEYSIHPSGQVWVRLPDGSGPCNLTTWDPVVHEDGTLTLSPSIDRLPTHDFPERWHGFLERDTFREV